MHIARPRHRNYAPAGRDGGDRPAPLLHVAARRGHITLEELCYITEDPSLLPVQTRGVRIHLAGGRLHKPPLSVSAQDAGSQARAEPARRGRGLDDRGATRTPDLRPHLRRDLRPVDSGSFSWGPGHTASLAPRLMAEQTI